MKLLSYGPPGLEKPALLDQGGQLRDLSAHLPRLSGEDLDPRKLAALAAIPVQTLPPVHGAQRIGAPFSRTRQFIAVGLNYSDHAAEAGMAIPAEPILFTKAVSCIQGPNDPVRRPRDSRKMGWEVELGVVIGQRTAYVTEAALEHVAGYLVVPLNCCRAM